jgi:hypothetical protein
MTTIDIPQRFIFSWFLYRRHGTKHLHRSTSRHTGRRGPCQVGILQKLTRAMLAREPLNDRSINTCSDKCILHARCMKGTYVYIAASTAKAVSYHTIQLGFNESRLCLVSRLACMVHARLLHLFLEKIVEITSYWCYLNYTFFQFSFAHIHVVGCSFLKKKCSWLHICLNVRVYWL